MRSPVTFRRDAIERVSWTAAQGALAAAIVEPSALPSWAIVPVMAGLAALKALIARRVGDPDSASTLREPEPEDVVDLTDLEDIGGLS